MRRTRWAAGLVTGLVAALAVPAAALADGGDVAERRRRQVPGRRGDQLGLGDRRRPPRDVHAGRASVPGDRLLARQERGRRGREDPRRTSRSRDRLLGGRLRARVRRRRLARRRLRLLLTSATRRERRRRLSGRVNGHARRALLLPVRLLRGVAGDRLGDDARAHQVRRLHLYAVVFAAIIYPLVAHWIFGGGWLQVEDRHAGLRRLDGGPPDRRDRRARGAAAARPAQGQVRAGRQAAGDPGAQHAAVRPRRPDPVARLVRVQPGLDACGDSTAASRRSSSSPTSRPPPA